jgi:hypothetical protein
MLLPKLSYAFVGWWLFLILLIGYTAFLFGGASGLDMLESGDKLVITWTVLWAVIGALVGIVARLLQPTTSSRSTAKNVSIYLRSLAVLSWAGTGLVSAAIGLLLGISYGQALAANWRAAFGHLGGGQPFKGDVTGILTVIVTGLVLAILLCELARASRRRFQKLRNKNTFN